MLTSVRDALKALVVTAAAIVSASATSAAPFVLTVSAETEISGSASEWPMQTFADDTDLIFGLSFHARPRGSARVRHSAPGAPATGGSPAQQYKFAESFPTMQPSGFSSELHCLALNIYHEARGEPESGKRAVGHVVMNRVTDRRFPTSVCQVVRQGGERRRNRCQFSWWCDGRSDRPRNASAWRDSLSVAQMINLGKTQDPTGGALWYHADSVRPKWANIFKSQGKIGRHIFYIAPPKRVARPNGT